MKVIVTIVDLHLVKRITHRKRGIKFLPAVKEFMSGYFDAHNGRRRFRASSLRSRMDAVRVETAAGGPSALMFIFSGNGRWMHST